MLFGAGHIGRQMVSAKKLGPIAPDANSPTLVLDLMTPGTLDPTWTFTRASTATYYDGTGVIQTAAINVPRWDYDPSTQQLNGLLLEEARTNLILNSGDFTNASWIKAVCTLAAGVTGPNGATTGSGIISNNGVIGYLGQNLTGVAGTTYTVSCFCKAGSLTTVQILIPAILWSDASWRFVIFDLSLGTVSSVVGGGASGTITPVGNGWYRCSITATPDQAATTAVQFARATANGNGVTIQHYAWGAQIEVGSYVTSYIPTTTATVARARDSLSMTAPGTWYDVTKGSMSFEYIPRGAGSFSSPAQLVGAAAGTDFIDCVGYTTTGTVPGVSYGLGSHTQKVGGVTQVQATFGAGATTIAANAMHRHAVSWTLGNGARAAVDGVNGVPGNPPAPAVLPTITSLTLSGVSNNQTQVSLWARKFQYWPRQLSQNELTLVSIGAM